MKHVIEIVTIIMDISGYTLVPKHSLCYSCTLTSFHVTLSSSTKRSLYIKFFPNNVPHFLALIELLILMRHSLKKYHLPVLFSNCVYWVHIIRGYELLCTQDKILITSLTFAPRFFRIAS